MRNLRSDLVVYLAAKTTSDIGYALDFVCMSVFIWTRTGSAFDTGLVSVALYAGAILGGQIGSRYGRTWNRLTAMIGADLIRMAALFVLVVLPGPAQTIWLYPVVFLVGTGRSIYEATLSAATPVLAGDRLQTVNSALAGLRGVAYVIGMAAATVVVPHFGFRAVFGLDASTYLVSALALTALRLPLRDASEPPRPSGPRARTSWPLLVATGLAALVILRGFDAFGSASQQIGLPILGSELHPHAPTLFSGLVWSAWAAGLFVAGFALRPIITGLVAQAPSVVFGVATIVMSVGFIGIFWLPGLWPRLIAAVVAGAGDAFSEITFKQAMQRLPDAERGPAFGWAQVITNSGFMAGLLITSLVLAPAFVARWVLLLHGVPILLAAWLTIGFAQQLRRDRRPELQEVG